jgi:hypothetical protein
MVALAAIGYGRDVEPGVRDGDSDDGPPWWKELLTLDQTTRRSPSKEEA